MRRFFFMSTGQGVAISMTIILISLMLATAIVSTGELHHHMYRIGDISGVPSDRIAIEWHQIGMVTIINFFLFVSPVLLLFCREIYQKDRCRQFEYRIKGWVVVLFASSLGIASITSIIQLTLISNYSRVLFYVWLDQICHWIHYINGGFVTLLLVFLTGREILKATISRLKAHDNSLTSPLD